MVRRHRLPKGAGEFREFLAQIAIALLEFLILLYLLGQLLSGAGFLLLGLARPRIGSA